MKYLVNSLSFTTSLTEQLSYYTVCNLEGRGCGWKEQEKHAIRSDCYISVCPNCGCDDIKDESGAV